MEAVSVLRVQRWSEMDVAARQQILHRGLDDIFEPSLRASIGELIDDVRERGDEAVCDALDRFDGITVSPDALRLSDDEYESATVSQEVASAIDDAITHLRIFNERQLEHSSSWSFESEPGLTIGEKITPITSAALFTPSTRSRRA